MSKITIYNPKGEELKTLLPKGFVKKKLMSDDYVQLEWNSTTYDTLVAGCYIDFEGERYTLLDNHTPTMKDELECRYEPKFERLTWRKYPMLYIEEGIEESEFVIDGKINIALTHIIKSIKKATGEIWQYVTDYNLTDNRFLSFDNFDIISALNHIAEVWECEWWIDEKEIHFGQCKLGDRIDLRVGEHIKVPSHTDFEPYYSKFRVFGSDKNIEQHQSDANVSARARLTLPDTYENSTIVVDEDTDYTTTVVFDEVYPKSFLEISEVKDNNLIKLKDFNLKDEDVIEGKTPEIHFSSGLLEGRDFELERYGEWLVLVEQGDELKFPNDVVKPKVGDSVVLWNIKMPDEYIQEARLELEKEALDYISDLKVDKRQYTARTNRVKFPYLDLIVGQNVKYIKEGHQGLDYELDARVLGFEFDLENRRDGTIIFGNELAKGSIETLKEQVDKIKEQPKAKDGTSVIVKDVLESTDDLPINPKNGDAYWVGSILYIWNGFTWVTSDLKGDKGEQPYIEEVNGVKYWFIGGVNTWVQAEGEDGKDGEDGDTPYIGQNGNWWIGDEDTGQKAEGEDGTSPYIGENGNWWFGTTDTGVQAKANDGKSPYIGTNKNWFIWDAAQNKFVDSGDTSVGDDGKSPEIRDGYWWTWDGEKWYNTGVKSKGEDGKDGVDGDTPYIGYNGNWWIGDEDTGVNPDGKAGPMLVQEGIYSSSVTYVADAVKKPLVFQPDNDLTPRIGKYYYPINVGEYTNISPKDNPSVWAVAEDYQVVLTDTLVAKYAKLGGAVFYGDYMISQDGVDSLGNDSSDFENFPDNFTPNLSLNFKTGSMLANRGIFKGSLINGYRHIKNVNLINGYAGYPNATAGDEYFANVSYDTGLNFFGHGVADMYKKEYITLFLPKVSKFAGITVRVVFDALFRSGMPLRVAIEDNGRFTEPLFDMDVFGSSGLKVIEVEKDSSGDIISFMGASFALMEFHGVPYANGPEVEDSFRLSWIPSVVYASGCKYNTIKRS